MLNTNKMEFTSPVPRWPGKIVYGPYLTFPQMLRWEQALEESKKLGEGNTLTEFYQSLLPHAIDLVKEWHIDGLPPDVSYDIFPASAELLAWLMDCVAILYRSTNSVDPKSPEPPSTT